ncbi:hypothetical protein ANN_15394 [Periplaneta americana]|uniref:Uncharacterized protein n=1 Tax=Periplaneta americana TaxID=6978 RepID=A0ABQ8SGA0_PERAM|nr:hypothetical protein ANN_15394 [Periplaneta americana]
MQVCLVDVERRNISTCVRKGQAGWSPGNSVMRSQRLFFVVLLALCKKKLTSVHVSKQFTFLPLQMLPYVSVVTKREGSSGENLQRGCVSLTASAYLNDSRKYSVSIKS